MQQYDACTKLMAVRRHLIKNMQMNAMHAKPLNTIMSQTGRAHQIKRISKCRCYIKYNTQTLTALPPTPLTRPLAAKAPDNPWQKPKMSIRCGTLDLVIVLHPRYPAAVDVAAPHAILKSCMLSLPTKRDPTHESHTVQS